MTLIVSKLMSAACAWLLDVAPASVPSANTHDKGADARISGREKAPGLKSVFVELCLPDVKVRRATDQQVRQ
jgi:hypothetical protein